MNKWMDVWTSWWMEKETAKWLSGVLSDTQYVYWVLFITLFCRLEGYQIVDNFIFGKYFYFNKLSSITLMVLKQLSIVNGIQSDVNMGRPPVVKMSWIKQAFKREPSNGMWQFNKN